MADWIQMPFVMVSGVSRSIGLLDVVVIVEGVWAVSGVNFGRPILTNGAFVA